MVFDDGLALRLVTAICAAAVVLVLVFASSARAQSPSCVISSDPNATAASQAPALRFGIYPGGPAVGTSVSAKRAFADGVARSQRR